MQKALGADQEALGVSDLSLTLPWNTCERSAITLPLTWLT